MSDDRILAALVALRTGQEQLQAGQERLRVDILARLDGMIEEVEALRAGIEAIIQPAGPHQTGV
jgi:hypothetical protein